MDQSNDKERLTSPRGRTRPYTQFGYFVTAVYLLGIVGYWLWRGDPTSFLALEPNAFGDFLAGIFAPLAFLWLVLGFHQQGEELRNSADALRLQGEELRNSVEQQRELVNVTREQLTFEVEASKDQREALFWNARPNLQLEVGSYVGEDTNVYCTFYLSNRARTCRDLVIFLNEVSQPIASTNVLETDQRFEFFHHFPPEAPEPQTFRICYVDERGARGVDCFRVTRGASSFNRVEKTSSRTE